MTVEVKVEETQMNGEVVAPQEVPKDVKVEEADLKQVDAADADADDKPKTVQKSSSFREESNFLSDLKESEKKALNELKSKLEEAILGNSLFKEEKKKEEKPVEAERETKAGEETKEGEESGKSAVECENEEKPEVVIEDKSEEIEKDVSLWGIPLLPSKGSDGTDVLLLKFLRAREFKVNDAFEILKKTLEWRKEANIDSIMDEDLEVDLSSAFYMNGIDREGHPVCYNIYGEFGNGELYDKALGTEEKRKQFLRWRFQLMEKGIQMLDLKPGGVTSLLQISDLKNAPSPSKKELRIAMKQAVGLLQDNYPEFVARNIFINAPFWFYALNALLSPFLTQRTKSKFVVARPAKVTESLLKYIPAEQVPLQYGGFKRDNDDEFSSEDGEVSELIIKAGSTEIIELAAAEIGTTLLWDLTVLGWEVQYKEEFVPNDEASYSVIIQKGKKMSSTEGPIRNIFTNNEPGKVVLTIDNCSSKKKRVLYRYKSKQSPSCFWGCL